MMTRAAARIAETLNANHAPLDLVLDFADMIAEDEKRDNVRFTTNRNDFVKAATARLSEDLAYQDKRLKRETTR